MDQEYPRYYEIFQAVRAGEDKRVMQLIDADPSLLDVTDSNVTSPLLVAFEEDNLELAERLIERGANVFVMDHGDHWAMQLITRRRKALKAADRRRLVEVAIAAGVTEIEIFHAVWRRDAKMASEILANHPTQASIRLVTEDQGSGFYNDLPYCGLTPLHYAVLAGDKRMVKVLLDAGAEVDAIPHGHEPDSRHTPMMNVPTGCGEIAELLVQHGANVQHTASYLNHGSRALRKVMIAHGAAGTPLMTALFLKQYDRAVQIARDDPSVINDRFDGETPLHYASKAGCKELMEVLLDHGMDVDTPSSGGDSALTTAAEHYCSFDIFKLLVERGADIHVDDDQPLLYTIWQHAYGHWDYSRVIRFLVRQGCKPRGLHHCAYAGNMAAAKMLIELGAEVNDTKDDCWPLKDSGHTPLDYCTEVAGKDPHPKLAKLLKDQGAVHASDLQG